jgi:glycosyltransferase involved in cell wall biosynthesis
LFVLVSFSVPDRRSRVLIFIVAYNAERTIQPVLQRIPAALLEYDTEILIIDDSSKDETFHRAREFGDSPFPVTVLFNPVNQRYGGNQKIGFHYAILRGFDFVALVHGDGQYAPERLPELLGPLVSGEADAVFGSRMMGRDALKGGMPYYKYAGNRILTGIQNRLLRSSLSEFHSGYRLYSVAALKRIPFERNTNDFHFDTEIIIQLFRAKLRVREIPIPTYYGDEICHVNGLKYAFDVIKATLLSRAQDLSLLYQRKFDVIPPTDHSNYQPKMGYESPHTMAISRVAPGSAVLDIGCASGYMAKELSEKGCTVSGIDQYAVSRDLPLKEFFQHNLDDPGFPVNAGLFDYILLLDVIEHLRSPEKFVESLRSSSRNSGVTRLVVSTGNIAFGMTRLLLLLGMFNYGPRGILDLTHTRLFTFTTMRALFEQCGYVIDEVQGVPAPFPLALGDNALSRLLLSVNRLLIRLSRGLFSYQIFMVVRPLPTLEVLLQDAIECSDTKVAAASRG